MRSPTHTRHSLSWMLLPWLRLPLFLLLPGCCGNRLEHWARDMDVPVSQLLGEPRLRGLHAFVYTEFPIREGRGASRRDQRLIMLTSDWGELTVRDVDAILSHELVHLHLPAEALPPLIEEGLCIFVCTELFPWYQLEYEATALEWYTLPETPEQLAELTADPKVSQGARALGYFTVRAMGLEVVLARLGQTELATWLPFAPPVEQVEAEVLQRQQRNLVPAPDAQEPADPSTEQPESEPSAEPADSHPRSSFEPCKRSREPVVRLRTKHFSPVSQKRETKDASSHVPWQPVASGHCPKFGPLLYNNGARR